MCIHIHICVPHVFRTTLDSFGQIGFGVDPGCLRTPDKVPFAAAFDSAQMVSYRALKVGGKGKGGGSARGPADDLVHLKI